MQENIRLAIEILKIILNWPAIVLIIILIFRKEMLSLISRIQSLGIGDKRIDFQKQEQESREKELEKKAEELKKELEAAKTQLEKDRSELNKHIFFESTYNIIFNSQVDLLKSLRLAGASGLRWNWIMTYNYPKILSSYPFGQFMNFLFTSGLLTWKLVDNNKDAIVTITPLGIEFLDYLELRGYKGIGKVI